MKKTICLLGASGSIGTQTLDVIFKNPNDFELLSFSVGKQTRKIHSIIKKFPSVKAICLMESNKVNAFKKKYPHILFFSENEGLINLINAVDVEMVVNALVGFVGLKPTLHALELNKKVALANKESLVVGGELINRLIQKGNGKLFPIDSEHSALWKCLLVNPDNVSKMVLTASGGAFRNLKRTDLKNVTPEMALNHPTWKMGNKITIDCATMINKAFEIIEAHYLYNYPYDKIGVKLHDESYVHSYLVYKDDSIRAEISKPDMRNPIKFALYEGKIDFKTYHFSSFDKISKYHFHDFDIKRYPIVKYAEKVINQKGKYGAVFNASNEIAVYAFLDHKIPFLDIEYIVSKCMDEVEQTNIKNYEQLLNIDKKTRQKATVLVNERSKLWL